MASQKKIVLLVEDNAIIRRGALEFLHSAGFEAIEASNADEAISVLEERPEVHLVFTDVTMPGSIDGVKLSHYIRERWPPVKLIVVSGQRDIHESHLPSGARFFLKPYNENSIVEAMRDMLSDFHS